MIECDKFYDGKIVGARWYPGKDDPNAPTLCLKIEVDGETILHYCYTGSDEDLPKLIRQMKAIGVEESQIHTEAFMDDPGTVIGPCHCRFKTKPKPTKSGKVSVGFLCDEQQDAPLAEGVRASVLARLKKAVAPVAVAKDDDSGWVPF